jgi:hypothetical protein
MSEIFNPNSLEELANANLRKVIDYSPNPNQPLSVQDLINTISAYFDLVNRQNSSPTFTGLAMSVGLNRKQLKDFPSNNPFSPYLERAKQYVIDFAEKQLFEPKSSAGVAFWLKNNDDWVDKTEVNLTNSKTMKEIIDEIDQRNNSPIVYDGEVEEKELDKKTEDILPLEK